MTPTPAMLAQQPKQYEGRDLRNAISQILVKNGMITNQVAIGELWELMLNVAVRNEQEAGRIAIEQTRQQVRDEAFSDAAEKLRVMREAIIASNEAFNHMRDLLSDEDTTPEEVLVKINRAVTANNAALADKE